MAQWEYLTQIISTNSFKAGIPKDQDAPMFAVKYLGSQLNELGKVGWELVSAVPCVVGEKEDIMSHVTGAGLFKYWTSDYLCVFKRPLEGH